MCTIAVMRSLHPRYPLLVAANRDEFYSRGAVAPAALGRTRGGDVIVAGRDALAGGSWMGATARGFFVGVTNQRTGFPSIPGRRSRGEVVRAALLDGTVEGVVALLARTDASQFNPFNLIFGDASDVRVAYARDNPASIEVHALGAGTHVLTNDRIGSALFPKAGRARALLDPGSLHALDDDALLARFTRVFSDHEVPDDTPDLPAESLFPREIARRLQALCIHTPVYGTVSSTAMLLTERGVARYRYAPGSPCVTAMTERTGEFLRAPARDPSAHWR